MLNVKEVNTRPANALLRIKSKTDENIGFTSTLGVISTEKLQELQEILEDLDNNGVDFDLEVRYA